MVIRHDTKLDKWNIVVDSHSDDYFTVKWFRIKGKRVIKYHMKRKRWEFDSIEAVKAFITENKDEVIIDPKLESILQ